MLQQENNVIASGVEGLTAMPLSEWIDENEIPQRSDLHTLASTGDYTNLEMSLERDRTSVSMKNKESWTPLMYACYNGCPKTVELLIKYGALKDSRNRESKTAAMIAAQYGNHEALEFFPEKMHLEAEDDNGWTSLFYAVDGVHHNAANILLQNGANVNKVDKYNGFTVAMLAAIEGKESMLILLLNSGADPTTTSLEGHTIKSLAISNGHNNLVQIIERYLPKELPKAIGISRDLTKRRNLMQSHQQQSKDGNYITSTTSNLGCPTNQILQIAIKQINLSNILRLYNMEKYFPVFEENNIDLGIFLTLSEEDLKDLGIKLFGPRRKMSLLIKHWNGCDICHNIAQTNASTTLKCDMEDIAQRLFYSNQEVENCKAFSSPTWGTSLFDCGSKKN